MSTAAQDGRDGEAVTIGDRVTVVRGSYAELCGRVTARNPQRPGRWSVRLDGDAWDTEFSASDLAPECFDVGTWATLPLLALSEEAL